MFENKVKQSKNDKVKLIFYNNQKQYLYDIRDN
jgi:hypothetical protein